MVQRDAGAALLNHAAFAASVGASPALPNRGEWGGGGRILAIRNPAAGRRRPGRFESSAAELRRLGFAIDLLDTRRRGDAEEFARGASAADCDLLLAAGGDGTVNEVANGIATSGHRIPLAVLPLGTTNVLAKEIGMPGEPVRFARTLAGAEAKPAWLGEVLGRRFALMASVGFDARVVAAVDAALKRRIGRGAYLATALGQLARSDRPRYRLVVDGAPFEAAAAIVCKGRFYGGRFVVAPDARVTAPDLHVCILPGSGRLDLCRYATRLAFGGLWRAAGVLLLRARTVAIEGPDRDPVQVDGDIVGCLPAVAKVDAAPIPLMVA